MASDTLQSLLKTEEGVRFLSYMKILNSPVFLGGEDPLDAYEWLERFKNNMNLASCPPELHKDIVVHFLDGNAILWWQEISHVRNLNTWLEFENEFKKQYLSLDAWDRIVMQLFGIRQGTRSVREFTLEFFRLLRFLKGYQIDKEQADIRRFRRCLRPEILTCLAGREFSRFKDLVEEAVVVEKRIEEEKKTMAATLTFGSMASSQPSSSHYPSTSRSSKGRFIQR